MPAVLSMTGFGKARLARENYSVTVEIKSANHRYLTVNCRMPDAYGLFAHRMESIIRGSVSRGSVFCSLQMALTDTADAYSVNGELARFYLEEMRRLHPSEPAPAGAALLGLPGVIREPSEEGVDLEAVWPSVEECTRKALDEFLAMRSEEGKRLAEELRRILDSTAALLVDIEREAGGLVEEYRERLLNRVTKLLAGADVSIDKQDLARELAIYADRADVSEEVVRMHSHIEQCAQKLNQGGALGRRLEFITQEMFREANTMASKALSARLTTLVIDLKGEVEKMKEQALNVE